MGSGRLLAPGSRWKCRGLWRGSKRHGGAEAEAFWSEKTLKSIASNHNPDPALNVVR